MNSTIHLAKNKDISNIHQLFVDCTDAMLAVGIKQWHYDYPNVVHIQKDVSKGEMFLLKEKEQCLGTITLNEEQSQQYKSVKWKFSDEKALVIHRLAVHPNAQGRGLGKQLCLFAEAFAKKEGYTCIRLDAYSGNPASNHLYERLGYHKADGLCHFHNNELPFFCWEKELTSISTPDRFLPR